MSYKKKHVLKILLLVDGHFATKLRPKYNLVINYYFKIVQLFQNEIEKILSI
ncbi:MAG: hypothetical protein ACTSVY_04720 [Candidatus Helarchaeota archaeon]